MNTYTALPGFNAPSGPSTPFGHGVLVFDIIRCSIIALAAVSIVLTFFGLRYSISFSQKVRFATTFVLILVLASIELEHFGDYANWRLGAAELGVLGSVWGLWSFLRYERPGSLQRIKDRDEKKTEKKNRRARHSVED